MFDEWESDHEYPTLFRVDRDVVVSTAEALPSTGRKLAGQPPIWVRSFGLQIEPQMQGRQIAWVRRSNGGWAGGGARPRGKWQRQISPDDPAVAGPVDGFDWLRTGRFRAVAQSA
jgi:hypothetical protein